MSLEEQDLVWKFRFYLTNQKKALTKFLKCVNWTLPQEAKQALELLYKWQPIDVDDALELLSPQFGNLMVRRYAVSRLQQAEDEDLLLYLLQLVQALKYEDFNEIKRGLDTDKTRHDTVSSSDGSHADSMVSGTVNVISQDGFHPLQSDIPSTKPEESVPVTHDECDLATFLIQRACKNAILANYLYWYLFVECEDQDNVNRDQKVTEMYINVMKRFSQALLKGGGECRKRRSLLAAQQTFVDRLVMLIKCGAEGGGKQEEKADPEVNKINFTTFDPIPMPLDPEVQIKGIVVEKATLFKSALMPSKLTFVTTQSKYGDDLRQDQLILQIITLMDKLLRKENLDLKLSPYKTLATASKHGFVQLVDAIPVAEILASEGTILNYLRKHSPTGYCVITYLLGVGDRHLDNLLLSKSGKLLHVDFGYILGRDPKPLPPPMKLCKEMVEAMGGQSSDQYQEFRRLCYTAFLHLRRSANLILNLFSLMVDANVQDKFRLDLNDEEAVHYMQTLIDESVGALFAVVVEQFHKFAQ
ncbi:Phosphatidylinositol 3-kinase catalytic subunit type 3, partial [Branchiostoma belcheri]